MQDPIVSIITPVYNGERFISKQIDSILAQTFPYFELILIDDHSNDRSMEIAKSYNDRRLILLYNEENRGIAFSTNRGIDASKGKYLVFLDDDDMIPIDRLEHQVEHMDENPSLAISGGITNLIDENDNVIAEGTPFYSNSDILHYFLLFQNVFCNGDVMVRKSVIVGNNIRIRENCLGMQDFRFFIDVSKVSVIDIVPRLTLSHRIHSSNMTEIICNNQRNERADLYAIFQKISIQGEGFILSEEDISAINQGFRENNYPLLTKEDINKLRDALQKILDQANKKSLQKDKKDALTFVCTYKFGKLCEKNNVFDLRLTHDSNQIYTPIDLSRNSHIMNNCRIVIAGAGRFLDNRVTNDCFRNVVIVGILDNNSSIQNTFRYGLKISSPNAIKEMNYDYVVMMLANPNDIREQLLEIGVDSFRIKTYQEYVDQFNEISG